MLRLPALVAAVLLPAAVALGEPSIRLTDCRITAGPGYPGIDARCGTFTRPLDPADSGSATIELKVAVVPAFSLEPATDPLVPIAGGPGQSTIYFYARWFTAFERVRQSRDIVLLDQRGTGESAPLTCDIDDDVVEGKFSAEQTLRATRECLAALPHDPRFFTTSVAVADLEALRVALGYGALNLYGISYGSRVAQHFARRYPESTRTVIVDGVVPPQLPLGPGIAIESQRAIERIFDRCAADPGCRARFPHVREDFQRLRDSLAAESVTVTLANPVTAGVEAIEFGNEQFAAAIRLLLYNPRTIALLPLLIDEAVKGNFTPLAAQFQMIVTSLAESLNIGMHNAVMCTEDAPFIDWDAIDLEAQASSYLGPVQLEAIRTMCSVWPAGVLDANLREALTGDKPVLLLSGDADPITPPAYAAMAASNLTNAWLLTGDNQGHGLAAVGCMPRVIGDFVATMRLEDGAADCLESAFAMPFFVDFSGPAP
ncbi:MAG: alpha/beta hydrolase [Gammaproteobacteria bacterium]|nr:alpha/beta hydrolase [Gammaproteobacteria bacterium]